MQKRRGRPKLKIRGLVKTKRLSVRVTAQTHDEIGKASRKCGRSITDQVSLLIHQSMRDDRVLVSLNQLLGALHFAIQEGFAANVDKALTVHPKPDYLT